MLVGEIETFPLLISASPRLLFDFLTALRRLWMEKSSTLNTAESKIISRCNVVPVPGHMLFQVNVRRLPLAKGEHGP